LDKTRILVLGGGFGGVYTALHLERMLGSDASAEITLVSRDNFFLFTSDAP
jgi:NADH dehydrogenase